MLEVKVCTAKLIPNELSARDDVKLVPNLVQNFRLILAFRDQIKTGSKSGSKLSADFGFQRSDARARAAGRDSSCARPLQVGNKLGTTK